MKDTKKETTKLNPEIKKKAGELFDLLEDEIIKSHEDELAEVMAEQLGDFIKKSKGFDQLLYAYELSKTTSEKAIYGLEESVYHMNDEAFFTLTKLYEKVLSLVDIWNTPKEERSEWADRHFHMNIREAESAAKEVKKSTSGLWKYRSKAYRQEIEELKEA